MSAPNQSEEGKIERASSLEFPFATQNSEDGDYIFDSDKGELLRSISYNNDARPYNEATAMLFSAMGRAHRLPGLFTSRPKELSYSRPEEKGDEPTMPDKETVSSGDKMYDFIRSELNDKLLAQEKLTDAKVQRIEDSVESMKESNAQLLSGFRELMDEKIDRLTEIARDSKDASEKVRSSTKGLAWTVGVSVIAMLITIIIGGMQIFTAIIGLAK